MRTTSSILLLALALMVPGEGSARNEKHPSKAPAIVEETGKSAPRQLRATTGREDQTSGQESAGAIFRPPSQLIPHPPSDPLYGGNILASANVNGDGYDDIVAGYPWYDNLYENQGAVFVYFGSSTGLASTPGWTEEGPHLDAWLGFAGGAGDVNADGFDDLLVGAAPFYYDGKAFLYTGSASGPAAEPVWWNLGPDRKKYLGHRYGLSVTNEGDLNGDGYDDLVVGSEYSTYDGYYQSGSVNVYLGSPVMPSLIPDWTVVGRTYERLGSELSIAGDVNGDGIDDLIAGASAWLTLERAYVYPGTPAGPSRDHAWFFEPDQGGIAFGHSVDGAGDVNGDGYDDVIVGAPFFKSETDEPERVPNNRGRAYVFHGSPTGPSPAPSWTSDGDFPESWHGRTVRSVGDVNDDGFGDVLVMSYDQAHIYFGSEKGLDTQPSWIIASLLGHEISAATSGDVNGDGIDDIVAHVPGIPAFAVYFGSRCSGPRAPELPGNFIDENCDADLGACDPCQAWGSHGRYVSCVQREVLKLVSAGAISRQDGNALRDEAAHSDIGKQGYVPPECAPLAGCGNGIREGGEVCDGGDLDSQTCTSLSVGTGSLACRSNCRAFDTAGCAWCGNRTIEGNEICDGTSVGGATCQSLGYDGGGLLCNNECTGLDLRGCASACGDGVSRSGEVCDVPDFGGRTCESLGFDGGTLQCHPGRCDVLITTACQTTCGDGLKGAGEQCDGQDFGGKRCNEFNFHKGGTLRCRPDCTVDTSECFQCGDGIVEGPERCDAGTLAGTTCQDLGFEGGDLSCESCERIDVSKCHTCGDRVRGVREPCDEADLGNQTCASQGFDAGALACDETCQFDRSSCYAVCGDGHKGGGEFCDGRDAGGMTCRGMGFAGGVLGCSKSCDVFDTTNCCCASAIPGCPLCQGCGNGIIDTPMELCDGSDLGGVTCYSVGRGLGGTLRCNATCDGYSFSGCAMGCGNNDIDGQEVCDGYDVGAQSCRSLGFDEGTLRCQSSCGGVDTSDCCCYESRPGCTRCAPRCGNGIRELREACDGNDMGNATCASSGYDAGTLACNAGCTLNASGCTFVCGDGVRKGFELCDVAPPPGWSCGSLGYDAGVLACSATCDAADDSACCCRDGRPGCPACPVCGNNVIDMPFEACDGTDLGGETCKSQGRLPGTLACNATCNGFDVSWCTGFLRGPSTASPQ